MQLLGLPTEPVYKTQRLDTLQAELLFESQSMSCRLVVPRVIKGFGVRIGEVRTSKQVGVWGGVGWCVGGV